MTFLGPEANGIKIEEFVEIFRWSSGSNHLSGLKSSASGPHLALFRCIRYGIVMIGVLGGMYIGTEPYVISDGGRATPPSRVSRILKGSGLKIRSDSLSTARTG